ncbi:hypothetical protein [Sphingomonas crocodyli]|uniref:Uncharacterized protein n=1 Tax=Sphingomonas crocodyli TaxID=1979270 RepID=A0A437MA56_9SPHN|nr:hypothetical protein [Sphingomonas crocodyli]RVT94525.1 hypothetical protein EOD43_12015 [Sphingomonas crocodyli]
MKRIFLAATIAVATAGPGMAETLKAVPTSLDPTKAYILVEYRLIANNFADLPGSRKTLPLIAGLSFGSYDDAAHDLKKDAKGHPLIEAFRNREIVRVEGARLHLIETDPGLWVIAGWGDTSFALGSYSFRLEAGKITDLGVVTGAQDWAEGDRAMNSGDLMKMALLGPFAKQPAIAPMRASFRPRDEGDIPVPMTLTGVTYAVAFTPDQKFGNYQGRLVNRIEGANARLRDGATPKAD